jgi:release factor glutamine methyltransferase
VTVQSLLVGAMATIRDSSDSPCADAGLLLAHAVRREASWLVAHPDAEPSVQEAQTFQALCSRRGDGVPIAYIVGSAGFYGREFEVDDSVLVPRPETEHLVDEAIRFIAGPMRVLDVGTGCGAIACSIASETSASVDATDLSSAAIAIAMKSARRLGVADRCRFYEGDLAEPVRTNRYDVVVANLPYVPTQDLPKRPDPASFEPRLALDGGPDGLALYRKLIPKLPELINEEGLTLLEAAPPTVHKLAALLRNSLPTFAVSVVNDYANLPRYVRAEGAARAGGTCRRGGV